MGTGPHECAGVAHAVGEIDVITHPGHVGHDVSLRPCGGDGSNVVTHLVKRDVQGVLVPHHYVGDRVAHENDVNSRRVDVTSARFVVRRHHHQRRCTGAALSSTNLRGA